MNIEVTKEGNDVVKIKSVVPAMVNLEYQTSGLNQRVLLKIGDRKFSIMQDNDYEVIIHELDEQGKIKP